MAKIKERANGECTAFERKDRPGTWRGQAVWINPATGEKVVKSFDCSTGTERQKKKGALNKAQQWLEQVQNGLMPDADKITVGEWLKVWLDTYAKPPATRQKTFEKYQTSLKYVIDQLGNMRLCKLQATDLDRFLKGLLLDGGVVRGDNGKLPDGTQRRRPLSPATVIGIRRVLAQAIGKAVSIGKVARNVVALTEPPRNQRREIKTLTDQQVQALIESSRPFGMVASVAILLAVATGMRLGELFGLRWADIDLKLGTIHVQRALVLSNHGVIFQDTKTKKSRRVIPIDADVIRALNRYRAEQAWHSNLLGDKWQDNDLVLPNKFGCPKDTGHFSYQTFKKILRAAGLDPTICFHDLRHTHATLLLRRGVHPKIVQERLGHSTITLTLDTYSHVTPDMQAEAVKALTGLFSHGKS